MESAKLCILGQAVRSNYNVVVEVDLIGRSSEHRCNLITQDEEVVIDRIRSAAVMEQTILALTYTNALCILDTYVITNNGTVIHC